MRPFTRHFSKLAKNVSLHPVLVIPFILQISLAMGLTGWLSIRNGQQAVNDVASQLRGEITDRIQQYLQTYVATPHKINQLNADAVQVGEVNIQDLPKLEEHLWYQLQIKAQAKGLALLLERSSDVPQYIRTDESKLRQILVNLIGNAIKFTQTGHIILRVHRITDDANLSLEMLTLIFTVEDTGLGISPADFDRLFQPFVQTEAGVKSHEGTGLGLPISQRFAQLMGGDLTVKSQLGSGSTFTVELPTRAIVPSTLPSSVPTHQVIGLVPGQPTYRILVVEDKPENRRLLFELLNPIRFEVRTVDQGQAAIDLFASWMPDLIWMDMRMPVMNGYETTQRIKAMGSQAPIVIALTGSAFEEDRVAALAAGCDDFVRKPTRAEVIFGKMAEHLGVRYCYGEEIQAPSIPHRSHRSLTLTSLDLSVMSIEWIEQLHQAATRVNAKQILQLLEQIPHASSFLAQALNDLVDRFEFEEIVALTQHHWLDRAERATN